MTQAATGSSDHFMSLFKSQTVSSNLKKKDSKPQKRERPIKEKPRAVGTNWGRCEPAHPSGRLSKKENVLKSDPGAPRSRMSARNTNALN